MNLPRKYILVLFIPALFFAGCGVWEDFTTYFNLYYNTTDTFEEAEKVIYAQERDLFSTKELEVPGSAGQLLNKVVEKSSKILQFHSESSFVDDALLMLGKAFYYQKNYQKGLRKFQELIATRPESDLILETQLWIGKSQMRLKDFESGLSLLEAVLDTAIIEGEEDLIKDAFVEVIVYQISIENYADAINSSKRFKEVTDNDETKAEISYQLGKLYLEIDDAENAIAAFREVNDYSPTYVTEVNANIELAKALREGEKPEEALSILEDMSDENKYLDDYNQIDLETGITLVQLGRYDEALELLTYVDTTYANTQFSGIAKFKIGELYEYQFNDFDSAAAYYSRSMGGTTPPEYLIAANIKTTKFKKYQALRSTYAENEKKLSYILNPDLFIQDSVQFYDSLKEAIALAEAEREFGQARESMEQMLFETSVDTQAIKDSIARVDSLFRADSVAKVDSMRNIGMSDEDIFADTSLSRRPADTTDTRDNQDFRDFRRRPGTGSTQQQQTKIDMKGAPVRPTISADSVRSLIVKNNFELANLFFTELNLPDSAYTYYKDIVENYPQSAYYARALYGLGSYYETVNENAQADSIYNVIYDNYKDEPIVNAAATKLKKPQIDLEFDPAKDLYAEAEKLMNNENYSESVVKFLNISQNYPQSELAPKALYAGGWILENELKLYDSAAVVYDSVLSQYPKSEYASAVGPKVQLYNREKEKQRAIADSINALNAPPDSLTMPAADSLSADSLSADSLSADSLQLNNTLIDSAGTVPGNTELQEPVQTPLQERTDQNRKINEKQTNIQDSLQQRHETVIDSLQRRRGPEEMNRGLEETIDSLNPARVRETDE